MQTPHDIVCSLRPTHTCGMMTLGAAPDPSSGGEQGDPLMTLHLNLSIHDFLCARERTIETGRPSVRSSVHVASPPDRTRGAFRQGS